METQTATWLKSLQLGAPYIHQNFSITPLIQENVSAPMTFILLEQALSAGKATITPPSAIARTSLDPPACNC